MAKKGSPPTGDALRARMQEDAAAPVTGLDVKRIRALVATLVAEQANYARLEEQLKTSADNIRKISEGTLPLLLDEAGVPSLVIGDLKIEVGTEFYPAVNKENEPKFFAWLRGHKFGALIKNQVIVSFGMGEDEKAITIATQLLKKKLRVDQKQSVHPGTLKAWVKEQQEKKARLPAMLNINPVRRTKISTTKPKG